MKPETEKALDTIYEALHDFYDAYLGNDVEDAEIMEQRAEWWAEISASFAHLTLELKEKK